MIEPLSDREQQIPLGMLAKHDIAYLIQEKRIIKNYIPCNLSDAVYEMRLGSFAFRWEGDRRKVMHLSSAQKVECDKRCVYVTNYEHSDLILPPNSLTFVTTIERFNLPEDIIARFNLKVNWVHRGLLLGTGPIVNPKFKKYLLIPIHNFSSKEVQIRYGQKLIAVEFTKISFPHDSALQVCLDKEMEDVEALVEAYSQEANYVESSVSAALLAHTETLKKADASAQEAKHSIEKAEETINSVRRISIVASIVASVGVLFALIVGLMSLNNDVNSRIDNIMSLNNEQANASRERILDMEREIFVLKEELKKARIELNGNINK